MAKAEHLKIIKQGVSVWNDWRGLNPNLRPDLSGADLSGVDLKDADLSGANLKKVNLMNAPLYGVDLDNSDLSGAYLRKANLVNAYLRKAILRKAVFIGANLSSSDLEGADLREAILVDVNLSGANLYRANLSGVNLMDANLDGAYLGGANLTGADLRHSILINTDFTSANLSNCLIYGISAWDLKLEETIQKDLMITPKGSPVITVDNLEVAQFIYLLLHNEKIREVIDTITSKVVLILGRFTKARKPILDAIRNELRQYDYVPVMFDYEKPKSKSFIETVITLANMARFVIADVTNAKIVIQEIPQIVQSVAVPIVPLLSSRAKNEIITLFDVRVGRTFILDTFRYENVTHLMASLKDKIIAPAEDKAKELTKERKL